MGKTICAVVVTWNSDAEDIQKSFPRASAEADAVVVIDNGSEQKNLAAIKKFASNFPNIAVLENEKNEGLAAAFNRGMLYAHENGYLWGMTLDDNGDPEVGMTKKLLRAYEEQEEGARAVIAIVAPNYRNLKGVTYPGATPYFVQSTVATGQLIKTKIWKEVGGFNEDLFVAGVDHEFCFRILRSGYKTLLVPQAIIKTAAGPVPVVKSIFGRKIIIPNYSPKSYYYTYRNNLYIVKTYWRYVPRWILWNIISNIISVGKIVVFEEQKTQKLGMIGRGLWDALRNSYGKLEPR